MRSLLSHSIIWPALDEAVVRGLILPPHGASQLIWEHRNSEQEALNSFRAEMTAVMASMSPEEFVSFAAQTAEEINDFFAARKIELALESWGDDPDTIGVASVLKLLKRKLLCGVEAGFMFDTGYNESFVVRPNQLASPYFTTSGGQVIVHVPVEGDLTLNLWANPNGPVYSGFELYARWLYALDYGKPVSEYHGAMLPSLEFPESCPDMDWLLGFKTTDRYYGKWRVTQALALNKFAMGPQGLSAVGAFAAAVSLECMMSSNKVAEKGIYIFDHAGSLALTKNGHRMPLMVGTFGREDFSEKDVNTDELDW